ncbi:thiamine-phosphate kinase [Tenuibacillus multivorans]|uniref:Thiamine-monophosphate kinase n=1 Tax=Tenuibacillus multivorans TaxID=237069 RepID=A0A1H0E551_9BACI|nr:thiamine-phosphate kinase [Tenuibacillus multivorans]GEL76651.1 thiamine-monophosphate kinase [Tenuibacillus multivorans]SDN77433.1 thiamine-monophosphate kinase [Tenuibacillus multivorans]
MEEFNFINSIKSKYYKQSSVIKGIGDDGAIINPVNGEHLVISTDTMVENVHFSLDYMALEDIGHRVLAANISDLAAMGSRPLYYMVNISSPSTYDNSQLIQIMNGMTALACHYQMDLIGGDTTSSDQLVITVTVFGAKLSSLNRLRSSAKENDIVFVTGRLGEAAYGFKYIQDGIASKDNYFINRHIRPIPRIDFAEETNDIKRICLNDVSDGIASELNEIAEESNVTIEIDWSNIPIHHEMKDLDKATLKQFSLSSGEDFELVGTCSQDDWERIQKKCESKGIAVTHIGHVLNNDQNQAKVILKDEKSRLVLNRDGYQHGK